jgi:Xaa-Pro aminopeptidase
MLTSAERERRYRLVREQMQRRDISVLVAASNAQINQQGFVRFFSNLPIPIYSHGLLFPLEGEPLLFTPSPVQTYWAHRLSWMADEQIVMARPWGRPCAARINELGLAEARIGLLNPDTCPAPDLDALRELCPGADLVDCQPWFEEVRSQKSREELTVMRWTTQIADQAMRLFRECLQPNVSEREIVAEVEREVRRLGAERTFYLIASQPGLQYPYIPGDGLLTPDAPVLFSIELSGAEGYWSQVVRTFFWDEPGGELERMCRALAELRLLAQQELRPGREIAQVARIFRQTVQRHGLDFGIHFGHGLGLDVVEEPLVNTENHSPLLENQVAVIHPHLVDADRELGVWFGDVYLIGEENTEILSSTDIGF